MGRRGPARTPTAILKLRGSTLVTKRCEECEVKGPEGTPDRPDWLDEVAQAAWDEIVPLLGTMGVLTRIDKNALARYCRLWSRWRKAELFIEEKGELFPLRGPDGQVKCFQQWPQVSIAHRLALQLTRLEQEFGMTPSARARLSVVPIGGNSEYDPKERYFAAG